MSAARVHDALPPGYRLHWYAIESVLGQGGFGITYLAHDTNLDQKVAIKEFFPVELARRDADTTVRPRTENHAETYGWGLDRFITEARTLARFHHPGIVPVLSVFEDNGTAYMVMRYEEGESLEDALKFQHVAGEAALLETMESLLDGLALVHAAGFVHRDIKPDNIYLRTDGTPVLLDFGSARQALGAQTRTLTALVSPGYAPFEQYDSSREGEGKQGPWTDVYALGATLYRAVTGKGPPDAMARASAIMDGGDILVPATTAARGAYSDGFLAAIDRALAFRSADRPQSVAAWRAMLTGEAPSVGADTAPTELAPLPGAGGAREAPTAGEAASGVGASSTAIEAGAAPPRPARRAALALVGLLALVAGATWWWQHADEDRAGSPIASASPPAAAPVAPSATAPAAAPVESPAALPEAAAPVADREAEAAEGAAAEARAAAQRESQRRDAARRAEAERESQRRDAARRAEAQRERIDALLAQASADVAALRLTSPAGDNALERYREVLALDAGNSEAEAGLDAVADRYAALAARARERGDRAAAAGFLERGEAVRPGSAALAAERAALAAARAAEEAARRRAEEEDARREAQEAAAQAAAAAPAEPSAIAPAPMRVAVLSPAPTARAGPARLARFASVTAQRQAVRAGMQLGYSYTHDPGNRFALPVEEDLWAAAAPREAAVYAAAAKLGADIVIMISTASVARFSADPEIDVYVVDVASHAMRHDSTPKSELEASLAFALGELDRRRAR